MSHILSDINVARACSGSSADGVHYVMEVKGANEPCISRKEPYLSQKSSTSPAKEPGARRRRLPEPPRVEPPRATGSQPNSGGFFFWDLRQTQVAQNTHFRRNSISSNRRIFLAAAATRICGCRNSKKRKMGKTIDDLRLQQLEKKGILTMVRTSKSTCGCSNSTTIAKLIKKQIVI